MAPNASPAIRRALLAVVLACLVGGLSAITIVDVNDTQNGKPVDYHGLRISVPEDFVVQDVAGRVDGELACPETTGLVFAGLAGGSYSEPTCHPDGEVTIVYLIPSIGDGSPQGAQPRRSAGGLRYALTHRLGAVFPDEGVLLGIYGPDGNELFRAILASARPSPSRGLATPTTAAARTHTTDRMVAQIGCDRRSKASTYNRGLAAPFKGRQREAPVDCYVGTAGYRIIVPRADAKQAVLDYYTGVWLVVGPDWVVTATNEQAARQAQERLGGTLRPPPDGCCGPPTSDFLPGLGGPV